ncbi:hypothetical protein [Rhodococcus sp. X156]|uniref:hypothetical protein n=1 Tax=Rhodococcus sp. X156 TaxID=2499145 RepID=UPI000FD96003|nr:hypothetical protein [Rhodococcus sp. X156]
MSALVALMLVAAVVLAVTSVIHNSSGDGGDTANTALVDQPATQEVNAAAANVLKTAYTYSHTTLDADFDAAVKLMTPEMANQYNSNRDNIRKVATQAKTTTSATVVSNGVRLLSGDRAEVIAFVVINADNNGQALQASGYRFTANLLRDNGQWLLSGLTEA